MCLTREWVRGQGVLPTPIRQPLLSLLAHLLVATTARRPPPWRALPTSLHAPLAAPPCPAGRLGRPFQSCFSSTQYRLSSHMTCLRPWGTAAKTSAGSSWAHPAAAPTGTWTPRAPLLGTPCWRVGVERGRGACTRAAAALAAVRAPQCTLPLRYCTSPAPPTLLRRPQALGALPPWAHAPGGHGAH